MKPNPRLLALVFAGGALGTLARVLVGVFTVNDLTALFVANLTGTAFLAWFNSRQKAEKSKLVTEGKRVFWGAGFAGGFTTMSGLALWMVTMVQQQIDPVGAISIVIAQLLLGVLVYLGVMALSEPKAAQ